MKIFCVFLLVFAFLFTGCEKKTTYPTPYETSPSPSVEDILLPRFDKQDQFGDGTYVWMDLSHVEDGYVYAKRLDQGHERIKLIIQKDEQKYPYDMLPGNEAAFPLQMGDGEYEIRILKQVEGDTYVKMASKRIQVALQDPLSPYLYPNQIVNYTADSEAVKTSFALTKEDTTVLQRIAHLYEYVITHIQYDDEKAKAVANRFVLPIIDETLEKGTGICFDYAALLASMLRVQHIPTRLITGYAQDEYHAWVEIYLEGEGWINPKVYFAKETWSRMDPTFAASDRDEEGNYEQVYVY